MRNVFDQYSQQENRLTHALAVCLSEDPKLLSDFLGWLGVKPPAERAKLWVIEQGLPGDPPLSETDAEQRGLPDIVIHDRERWCVLIESKVRAALTRDQLTRHVKTLRRRDFTAIQTIALTKNLVNVPPTCIGITWSALYEWLGAPSRRREWPNRLRDYLRAAELRLATEGYLDEGTLTMFDGFPFNDKNPYTYGEAKRLLKLARSELQKSAALRELGVDPRAKGRPAITGRDGDAVWDFLSLADRPKRGAFTSYPHLTLAIHDDHLEVSVTIPNGVTTPVRRRLIALGADGLGAINAEILRRSRSITSRGAWIQAYAIQRHYPSQRSAAITDASLTFRLETAHRFRQSRTKLQPEWAALFAMLPRTKRSNIQFQYRFHMPWGMKGLDRRESLNLIAAGWIAMKPLLDALRKDRA